MFIGDRNPGDVVRFDFNTVDTSFAPATLSAGAVSIYKDGGTTESTAGVTLSADFDAKTGLHQVVIDTSVDGAFYAAGSDFIVVLTAGTVAGISVVGSQVGHFSLVNRQASIRSTDAVATNAVAIKAKTDNLPLDPADASDLAALFAAIPAAVWSAGTRLLTAGTNIVLAKGTGVTGFNDISAAAVNAEVVDALNVDTYAEPGQGAPAATLSLAAKIGYLFKAWRNKVEQTSTQYKLYADDAATVDQKATSADDGSTFTRGEIAGGP